MGEVEGDAGLAHPGRAQDGVEGDARLAHPGRAQGAHRQAVTDQQVVRRRQCRGAQAQARGVLTARVAEEGAAPRLVERDPAGDAVGQCVRDQGRVVGEACRRVPGAPAARVLEGLRELPVVERHGRGDTDGQQVVHQP
ncbi:hypothetical protein A4V12_20840 [Streptomyces noursei]|nr:hypothetical protein A4V12_20840 [Streptomyces noursei]